MRVDWPLMYNISLDPHSTVSGQGNPVFPGGTIGPGVSPVMRAWVGTCHVICTVPENVSALFLRIFNNSPRVGGQVIMCPFAHGNPEIQGG